MDIKKKIDDRNLLFLQSALSTDNPFNSTEDVLRWLNSRNDEVEVKIERIRFDEMKSWKLDKNSSLHHNSGKFFKIEGIEVSTNWGEVDTWKQPIINQPEIGILGILTKEINGILYFLMQAKIEPGNVNYVQLSPTLQATKSNYTQVHKGNKPNYLDYFLDLKNNSVLLDQLQSEQGARFLKKRNRNIIIRVEEEVSPHEDFIWLTLGQIKQLSQFDNIVNMDTRTVISGIPFGSYDKNTVDFYATMTESDVKAQKMLSSELDSSTHLFSFDDIIHWFTKLKAYYELDVKKIPLKDISHWNISSDVISHEENKYFNVIAVNVIIGNREVKKWDQPLIEPVQEGICAFVVKEINGRYHFLVQAKLESGNFDILELAPTVQCLTGSYDNNNSIETLPFLKYVIEANEETILHDSIQSEEGGRFYREQNRNLIVLANDDFPIECPTNYTWLTLNQLKTFIKFNNYLNIQARSLISVISYY